MLNARVCVPYRSSKSAERKSEQKETLVRQRLQAAFRLRGTHQRGQAQTSPRTGKIQGFCCADSRRYSDYAIDIARTAESTPPDKAQRCDPFTAQINFAPRRGKG